MRIPDNFVPGAVRDAAPWRTVAMVASHLLPPRGNDTRLALLDPCAGEGAALAQLVGALGGAGRVMPYAVEISDTRMPALLEQLDLTLGRSGNELLPEALRVEPRVLARRMGQAIRSNNDGGVKWNANRQQFDLAWFYPECGTVTSDASVPELKQFKLIFDEGRVLKADGVFVGVFRQARLHLFMETLLRFLNGPRAHPDDPATADGQSTWAARYPAVYRLPDPEFAQTGLVVVIGTLRTRKRVNPNERELALWLDIAQSADCPVLDYAWVPQARHWPRWRLPSYRGNATPKPLFNKTFDPQAICALLDAHGWETRPEKTGDYFGEPSAPVTTARPLNPGHLAQAAVGGLFDNQLLDTRPEGGDIYLLKGNTEKTRQQLSREVDERGIRVTVWQETFVSEIYMLSLGPNSPGEFCVARIAKVSDASAQVAQAQAVEQANR